jgi:hypothetical protein
MLRIIILLLIFKVYSTSLRAQPVQASLQFEATDVLIGDQLRGFIVINAPEGKEVGMPNTAEFWKEKNMEIFNISNPEKTNSGAGQQTIKQSISLIFWDTGFYELPALPFYYVNDSQNDTVYSGKINISVRYPEGITGDSSYLAPIKPILEENKTFWDYIVDYQNLLFGFLAFLLIAALAYFVYKMQQAAAKKAAILSPEAKALDALQKLIEAAYIEKGEFANYHETVSFILREYLQDRFGIRAMQSITTDILLKLDNDKMNDALKRDLQEVLETADLVKFAKASPLSRANDFAADYIRKLTAATLEKLEEEKIKQKK